MLVLSKNGPHIQNSFDDEEETLAVSEAFVLSPEHGPCMVLASQDTDFPWGMAFTITKVPEEIYDFDDNDEDEDDYDCEVLGQYNSLDGAKESEFYQVLKELKAELHQCVVDHCRHALMVTAKPMSMRVERGGTMPDIEGEIVAETFLYAPERGLDKPVFFQLRQPIDGKAVYSLSLKSQWFDIDNDLLWDEAFPGVEKVPTIKESTDLLELADQDDALYDAMYHAAEPFRRVCEAWAQEEN